MIRLTKIVSLLVLAVLAILVAPPPSSAQVSVGVAIHIGPPILPVYTQPICPGAGYMWTPGYWAYGPDGYFWVPGTWVVAPAVGLLWTPGYWGWGGGGYLWHGGYWGPHVGFYGGVSYGFGYTGVGFAGGEWRGGVYHYNTAVTNVNTTVIHNTYNTTVINNNTTVNRVSYNGGTGGTTAQPTAAEQAAAREPHTPATATQTQHQQAASSNRALLASQNHGNPAIAASQKPGVFNGPGIVAARPVSANANRPSANTTNNARNDRPPNAMNKSTTSNTNGNGNRPNGNTPQNASHTNSQPPTQQNNNRPPAPTNTTHTNQQQPQQHSSKPPEHESHPSEHPGHGR
ncbi:MAG: hypothetical protein WCE52_10370 [Candidatus Acidiferrum sp.]